MPDLVVQASFNAGEWAPALYARVDVAKYRTGAAKLFNFFVDYRGGASTRPGSKYILQALKSATPVRLIPFQAAFNVGYALEFGDYYVRFYFQGSPVLENGFAISAITNANPAVATITGNNYAVGNVLNLNQLGGMPHLSGRYVQVLAVAGAAVTLGTLNGANLDTTTYGTYTGGGQAQRVYTKFSPYAAADLALLKFAQIQGQMVFTHPSYQVHTLTLYAPANWGWSVVSFGSSASPPGTVTLVASNTATGTTNYSYVVTTIDGSGQESEPSPAAHLNNAVDMTTTPMTIQLSWPAVSGAVAYNVYKNDISYFGVVPTGMTYGFIGTTKGVSFADTNIIPDFAETPPIANNPFVGSGVASVTVTAPGIYTTVPTVTDGGGGSAPATYQAVLSVNGTPPITASGVGYAVGNAVNFGNSLVMAVDTIDGSGRILSWHVQSPGFISTGTTPANPLSAVHSGSGIGAETSPTWGVASVSVGASGAGYLSAPTIAFAPTGATATSTLAPASGGNPGVCGYFQQRLVLAAPTGAPSTLYMSQPGAYFNFDVTNPVTADNSITETLVNRTAEGIKSFIGVASGLLMLTDQGSWLINGGQGAGSAVSANETVANRQSGYGANDVPPIQANYDILYVGSKGSAVRDLAYNIYYTVFTGTDISTVSSHLFFGHQITEWAWAEAPYYVVWAVRDDGIMLSLTFLKDQDFVAWAQHGTPGNYMSVCAVTEQTTDAGNVDAVYTVAQRVVNGVQVQYIERFDDRAMPGGISGAWCVDAGIQYTGAPTTTFSGAEHLAGLHITGLQTDDQGNTTVIPGFDMPQSGIFSLAPPPSPATGYTTVTVGRLFSCQLQTLALDVGQPPIQGKLKKIPYVDVRCINTATLEIGGDFSTLVMMKDTVPGNISSMKTGLVTQSSTGLYNGDARTYLDPSYNVLGQFCIQQTHPYPATVTGVFPCLDLGDIDSERR